MLQVKNLTIFSIRGASIGLKTLFILLSAKFLSLPDLGRLTLVNTSISLMLSIMGVNFFNYTSRILIESSDKKNVIYNHFVFTSFTGLLSLILTPLLILYGGIELSYFIWFSIILFLEHIFTEIFRIQIPLNQVVQANVVHLLRTCCSTVFPLILLLINREKFNLDNILMIWITSLASLLLILICTKIRIKELKFFKFDKQFIREGLRTSAIYLAITIVSRSLFTLDKYIINFLTSVSEVGIYSFFYSMAFTIQTLVDTSIISPSTYEILKSKTLTKSYYSLLKKVILTCLILGGCLSIGNEFVLKILNRAAFISDSSLLYIFIIAATCLSLSSATMMPLYALKKDSKLLKSYVLTFLVFIILNFLNHSSMYAVATNMAISFLVLFLGLFLLLKKNWET